MPFTVQRTTILCFDSESNSAHWTTTYSWLREIDFLMWEIKMWKKSCPRIQLYQWKHTQRAIFIAGTHSNTREHIACGVWWWNGNVDGIEGINKQTQAHRPNQTGPGGLLWAVVDKNVERCGITPAAWGCSKNYWDDPGTVHVAWSRIHMLLLLSLHLCVWRCCPGWELKRKVQCPECHIFLKYQ